MPWGHVAGKWYGSENVRPILMIHGWQDNAGSFDPLIPLLPSDNISYLAIDLPGHGHSSHLPKGCFYHFIDFVPLLEHIRKQYKWEQLSLIAHSMGSVVSFIYAALFPKNTNLVCGFDMLKILNSEPRSIEENIYQMKKLVGFSEDLIQNPPEYTYDVLPERIREGLRNSVDLNKAKYLMTRGVKASPTNPNKFYFTRDIRIKYMLHLFAHQSVSLAYIKRITAPYLFFRGEDRFFSDSEANINEAVDMFRKHNERFEMIKLKGTHHFHLNQPEQIAGPISDFLKKYHNQQE